MQQKVSPLYAFSTKPGVFQSKMTKPLFLPNWNSDLPCSRLSMDYKVISGTLTDLISHSVWPHIGTT